MDVLSLSHRNGYYASMSKNVKINHTPHIICGVKGCVTYYLRYFIVKNERKHQS